MPAPISFQPNVKRPGPLPQPARNPKLNTFGSAPQAVARDTVRFGHGVDKTTQTDDPAPNDEPEATTPQKKEQNWFQKRVDVSGHAFKDMFHGGKFFDWRPLHGWKSDILQSTVVTLPLTILPGSQLIVIPLWIAGGALARGLWTFSKGMFSPDKVLKAKREEAAAESTPPTS